MNTRKILSMMILAAILIGALLACSDTSNMTSGNQTQTPAQAATGHCDQNTSTACSMVIWRYGQMADANKIGYFYGMIEGVDHPLVLYIVKGGLFPVDDMTTPPDVQVPCGADNNNQGGNMSNTCAVVRQAQQPDGTWGTNGNAMFGKLANGEYFEWQGHYAFSFEPLPFLNVHIVGCPTSGTQIPGC